MTEKLEDKTNETQKDSFFSTVKSATKEVFKFVKYALWGALIFVILTNLGGIKLFSKYFGTSGDGASENKPEPVESISRLDYDLDEEVLAALDYAYSVTYDYVSGELDKWIFGLEANSEIFIDDYYKYTKVKYRELKSLITPSEKMMADLEDEISRKVIKPPISQQKIENITNEAVSKYRSTLEKKFAEIRVKHNIPEPEWNRYICSLCDLTHKRDMKSSPIAVKGLILGGAGASIPVVATIWTCVEKTAAKKGLKVVAKSGAKTLLKGTTAIPVIGAGVGALVLVWDVFDYNSTAKKGKVELKADFSEFFQQVKEELLGSSDKSIMGAITQWENGVKAKIKEGV